ncbi:MAG: PspA/IM30 family protein [Lachnospiraceae bacterium]|nr:PspA/IM30 family protein [Lachnospiraceae bacterium]
MAGILKRFKDIMAANINALLDKAENPEKMIDQYLRDMENDLQKVKEETASVMAEATRAKRVLDEQDAEIAKMQKYAEKAVLAGNDGDAKKFLERKLQLTNDRAALATVAENAQANADKMRAMHDKLTQDIATLNERKASIKAKVQAAKAQEKMNELSEKVGKINITDGMSAFDKMEEKANKMLDKANAKAELNNGAAATESVSSLASKYDTESSAEVDDELAALKAQMGL